MITHIYIKEEFGMNMYIQICLYLYNNKFISIFNAYMHMCVCKYV
jgi:hypothetical protein